MDEYYARFADGTEHINAHKPFSVVNYAPPEERVEADMP
jgi:hypothetical protein